MIKAIITDIEGTTTDIKFVHSVLFPYSKKNLPEFILANLDNPNIQVVLDDIRHIINFPQANPQTVINQLLMWIDEDKKITPLKTLQGYLWQDGYERGLFKSHVYSDAYTHLVNWYHDDIKLYVYSSGSVKAQRLLFKYSTYGDMTYLFDDYFDTEIGGKKDSAAYAKIIASLPFSANETLFLSDVVEELDAAKKNGIRTVLINRDGLGTTLIEHKECASFEEINLLEIA